MGGGELVVGYSVIEIFRVLFGNEYGWRERGF